MNFSLGITSLTATVAASIGELGKFFPNVSTIEKEEEWLNQVGEQQGVLEKYPDGAFGNPTGLLNDVPKDPLVDPIDVYDRYPFNNSEDN